MRELGSRRPSYANVAATLALVFAIGGGLGYAAATIGPGDIAPNAVRSKHVKKNAIRGKQVKESTLGLVPSARDARTVGGVRLSEIDAAMQETGEAETLFSAGGFDLRLEQCSVTQVTVALVDNGDLRTLRGVFAGGPTGSFEFATTRVDATTAVSTRTAPALTGLLSVHEPGEPWIRIDWDAYEESDGLGGADDCVFHGFVREGA
jgi:hypothetical protein